MVLMRHVGETINIGETITVTVLGVEGNQVRVGVSAPTTVVDGSIHRPDQATDDRAGGTKAC